LPKTLKLSQLCRSILIILKDSQLIYIDRPRERERERERMGTKDSLMRRSHTKAMNMSNCDHVKDAFMGVDKDSVCLLPKPFK